MAGMLTLAAFEEAAAKVKEVTQETKLVESPSLSTQCGNRVWLKPENMQRTGAYKLRGAYYTRSPSSAKRSSIAASSPRRRQPRAGRGLRRLACGCAPVVVMPTTTPLIKSSAPKGYGAEVVLFGDVFDEA